MKRLLWCGLALVVCCVGAGNSEAAVIKADVDTDWTTPRVLWSDSSEVPITLARHGYRYGGHGCYYGPPRRYRSHWRGSGYGYGHGHYRPRRNVYYGHPYGHGHHHHHHGGFGLYIGF